MHSQKFPTNVNKPPESEEHVSISNDPLTNVLVQLYTPNNIPCSLIIQFQSLVAFWLFSSFTKRLCFTWIANYCLSLSQTRIWILSWKFTLILQLQHHVQVIFHRYCCDWHQNFNVNWIQLILFCRHWCWYFRFDESECVFVWYSGRARYLVGIVSWAKGVLWVYTTFKCISSRRIPLIERKTWSPLKNKFLKCLQ